jgi:hypothetical protein
MYQVLLRLKGGHLQMRTQDLFSSTVLSVGQGKYTWGVPGGHILEPSTCTRT